MSVSLQEIQKAKDRLQEYLHPTPLVYNPWLSEFLGAEIHLKLESMQPIGSFKIRGATYKISHLSSEQKKRGVIAASAGNHAQGVAWGSHKLGVHATIVMPVGAPLVKVQNTKALGADVILHGENYDQAFEHAQILAQEKGFVFVHAFEDPLVIAGQGTLGLEILEQLPDVDCIVSSVGGGGLLAGVAIATKGLKPNVQLMGCQASGAASMIQSIQKGTAIRLDKIETFADGISVVGASEMMRQHLAPLVDHWVVVEDQLIAIAIVNLLEKAKIVTEGAGAAPLAAFEKVRHKFAGKKVVLVISGGNIDVNVLSRIIDVGLVRTGRRVRVNALLPDRPGSLAKLTDLIAKQGANILQAIHDRNEPSTQFNQTDVALTLETRGPDHSATLIEAMKKQVLRLDLIH